MGYIASAVNMVSSNACVGPSPRIKTSLFLLSIWIDEPIGVPKIITLFSKLSFVNENFERGSNPVP